MRARHVPEWDGDPDLWFMDYRNADGSLAQMCGNGVRVFVRYLLDEGLASGPDVDVATRAGLKPASVLVDGRVRVAMGPVAVSTGRGAGDHRRRVGVRRDARRRRQPARGQLRRVGPASST